MIGVIFGPPGSGKGTQAAAIDEAFDLDHLSTGEILRGEMARATALGKQAKQFMAAGQLVPDRLLVPIVQRRLRRHRKGVLLDGFPRTLEQARALDALLAKDGRRVDFVVALEVPEEVLVERLLHRAAVEGRADDTREAIGERMLEYHSLTAPVLEHYRQAGVAVAAVDAMGTPEAVAERIRKALNLPRGRASGRGRPAAAG